MNKDGVDAFKFAVDLASGSDWSTISTFPGTMADFTADDVIKTAKMLKEKFARQRDPDYPARCIQAAFMLTPSPTPDGRRLFADAMMAGKPSPGLVDWLKENGHDDAAAVLEPYLEPVTEG